MKAELNSLLEALSGTIGNVTFKTRKDGTIIVAKKQKAYPVTPHQRRSGQRMKAAHQRARDIIANDPEKTAVYREYAARRNNGGIQQAIVVDILQRPRIHHILWDSQSRAAGNLMIEATDDHRVVEVAVRVYRNEELLEEGTAPHVSGSYAYCYTLQQTNLPDDTRIEVCVTDFADNRTLKTLSLQEIKSNSDMQ